MKSRIYPAASLGVKFAMLFPSHISEVCPLSLLRFSQAVQSSYVPRRPCILIYDVEGGKIVWISRMHLLSAVRSTSHAM